jgi:hypothetical protein
VCPVSQRPGSQGFSDPPSRHVGYEESNSASPDLRLNSRTRIGNVDAVAATIDCSVSKPKGAGTSSHPNLKNSLIRNQASCIHSPWGASDLRPPISYTTRVLASDRPSGVGA